MVVAAGYTDNILYGGLAKNDIVVFTREVKPDDPIFTFFHIRAVVYFSQRKDLNAWRLTLNNINRFKQYEYGIRGKRDISKLANSLKKYEWFDGLISEFEIRSLEKQLKCM